MLNLIKVKKKLFENQFNVNFDGSKFSLSCHPAPESYTTIESKVELFESQSFTVTNLSKRKLSSLTLACRISLL